MVHRALLSRLPQGRQDREGSKRKRAGRRKLAHGLDDVGVIQATAAQQPHVPSHHEANENADSENGYLQGWVALPYSKNRFFASYICVKRGGRVAGQVNRSSYLVRPLRMCVLVADERLRGLLGPARRILEDVGLPADDLPVLGSEAATIRVDRPA